MTHAHTEHTRRFRRQITAIFCCSLLVSLLLTGCGSSGVNTLSSRATYEVSPVFREFHASLGGEEVLGPAISQVFNFEKYECQYTVNTLMCQNPLLSGETRFILYPLGMAFEIQEPAEEKAAEDGELVVNGLSVYEEFIPVYEQFSAARYAGNPITPVRINYSQRRIEQYFENIGLYRSFDSPPGVVNLLAYGAFACDEVCSFPPTAAALIVDPAKAGSDQPFLPALGEMDSSTVFGIPLTQPYIAADGALEQVYTNAVLYSPPNNPKKISLRPLPELLGMPREDPVPQLHDSGQNVVFYPVKDELGFHVPTVFDEFIVAHGGRKLSGDPISETVELKPGLYRQCFTNYCLLYEPSAVKMEQVTLAPLGKQYLDSLQAAADHLNPMVISSDTVTLQVNELFSMLPRGEIQRIGILVVKTEDQAPLAGIESTLDLMLPDGTKSTSELPPTDVQGKASIKVPDQDSIPNGTILVYEVCLKTSSSLPVCEQGSYMIWKAP